MGRFRSYFIREYCFPRTEAEATNHIVARAIYYLVYYSRHYRSRHEPGVSRIIFNNSLELDTLLVEIA